MSPFKILVRKELWEGLRDRRTIMMMLLPILIYPVLMPLATLLIGSGMAKLARAELKVALCDTDSRTLLAQKAPPHTTFVDMEPAAAETALRAKEIEAFITAAPGSAQSLGAGQQAKVTVSFTRREDKSGEARDRVVKLLRAQGMQVLEKRLEAAHLPASFAQPVQVAENDIDFKNNIGPKMLSTFLPYFLMLMLVTAAFYPAITMTAGEKEAGTLETLLLAPLRPTQVMASKYFVVTVIALVVALLNIAMIVFSSGLAFIGDATDAISFHLTFKQVAMLTVAVLPLVCTISAVCLALASLAKTYREAQSLLSPLIFAVLFPGMAAMAPGMELNAVTACVPLLDVALLIKAIVLENARIGHLLIVLAVNGLMVALAVPVAANAFKGEAIRFGGKESWKDLFRFGGA